MWGKYQKGEISDCADVSLSEDHGKTDGSRPGDAAAKDLLWQKDVHKMGEATCPACGERRPYGPGGVSNLEKRHLNSGKCLTAAEKRDKLPRPNQSIFGFLKAKVPAIPATVSAPAPVISATSAFHDLSVPLPSKLAHAAPGVTASRSSKAAPKASPRLMDLIRQLRNGCRHLPFNIPEADDSNPLARFSGDPASYVGKDVPSDSLWETLETHFHGAFDYGKGPEEREGMIQTGPQGLGGFLRCALCNPKDPAVWRYNFKEHMMQHHSDVSLTKYSHIWELCTAETAGMKKVWVARDKRKKAKKAKPSLVVSSAHSSRLALAVEIQSPSVGPDRSLSPESFRNASSVPTPEVSDDEEGTKLIPPSLSEDIQHTPEFPAALLPRVGDFMEVDHDIPPIILDTAAMAEIPLKPSDALPSIAEAIPSETQAPLNVIVHSCSPVARPSSIPLPVMTINPILPVTQPTVSSRSGRKRVAKDVGDLSLCICGDSAVPIDSKSTGDVAHCKIEGCETKWYHLDCLNLESVTDTWVCDACVHLGSARGP
ncbi:hypothetical protein B0H17DRAFT_1186207 [Mycena rosella]|uniref:Zinc finger PHD-type domain-containing protein n=1 Tax=Mycena rosella TaxID=1033263 RepID=A0AAD7CN58_MYCRO|nr:hypothetical protein B0H17DRAFT_1186207 [Mycena rosella]